MDNNPENTKPENTKPEESPLQEVEKAIKKAISSGTIQVKAFLFTIDKESLA